MSQNATKMRLEDLEIKPHLITKLKGAGIESIFDLAISIPHQLIEDGGILTGTDSQIALDLVMKAMLLKIINFNNISSVSCRELLSDSVYVRIWCII